MISIIHFSSPHLIEVKERIKIKGKSLSYAKFQEYFDYCYDILITKWVK
jgi:folylpolyglutamate synthase/dihydropteroate synthase